MDTIEKVREFHEAFGVREVDGRGLRPTGEVLEIFDMVAKNLLLLSKTIRLAAATLGGPELVRLQLMTEELGEWARGVANGDVVEQMDALCDLRYVNDGTILVSGLASSFYSAFREVHRSNMTKLDEEGKPVKDESGRVVKGDRYEPPDLSPIVRDYSEVPISLNEVRDNLSSTWTPRDVLVHLLRQIDGGLNVETLVAVWENPDQIQECASATTRTEIVGLLARATVLRCVE